MPGTRWTLAAIHDVVDWLDRLSLAGIHHLLDRLRLRYKRARDYVHSPDPDYLAKLAQIATVIAEARVSAGRSVALYLDEITYYRQPTLAHAYEEQGPAQPLARRSYRANTPTRLVGTLNPLTGQVLSWQGKIVGVAELVAFFQRVCQAHPDAARLHLALDNWPVHFHPDLLVALEPQENPWPFHRPPSWATEPSAAALARWGNLHLPIQLHPLPTYASWTNPIEKLWRKLRQDRLHLHRLADDLVQLHQTVAEYLEQFAAGSLALLHYVGLQPVPI
jgi:transposase